MQRISKLIGDLDQFNSYKYYIQQVAKIGNAITNNGVAAKLGKIEKMTLDSILIYIKNNPNSLKAIKTILTGGFGVAQIMGQIESKYSPTREKDWKQHLIKEDRFKKRLLSEHKKKFNELDLELEELKEEFDNDELNITGYCDNRETVEIDTLLLQYGEYRHKLTNIFMSLIQSTTPNRLLYYALLRFICYNPNRKDLYPETGVPYRRGMVCYLGLFSITDPKCEPYLYNMIETLCRISDLYNTHQHCNIPRLNVMTSARAQVRNITNRDDKSKTSPKEIRHKIISVIGTLKHLTCIDEIFIENDPVIKTDPFTYAMTASDFPSEDELGKDDVYASLMKPVNLDSFAYPPKTVYPKHIVHNILDESITAYLRLLTSGRSE